MNKPNPNLIRQCMVEYANREGYKLVPLEPSQEMLIAADNCEIGGKVTANNIYKAMIGACDDYT